MLSVVDATSGGGDPLSSQRKLLLARASKAGASLRGPGGSRESRAHRVLRGGGLDEMDESVKRINVAMRAKSAARRDVEGISARVDDAVSEWSRTDVGMDLAEHADISLTVAGLDARAPARGSDALTGVAAWLSRAQDDARTLFAEIDFEDSPAGGLKTVDVARGASEAATARGAAIGELRGTVHKFKDTAAAIDAQHRREIAAARAMIATQEALAAALQEAMKELRITDEKSSRELGVLQYKYKSMEADRRRYKNEVDEAAEAKASLMRRFDIELRRRDIKLRQSEGYASALELSLQKLDPRSVNNAREMAKSLAEAPSGPAFNKAQAGPGAMGDWKQPENDATKGAAAEVRAVQRSAVGTALAIALTCVRSRSWRWRRR